MFKPADDGNLFVSDSSQLLFENITKINKKDTFC